jgi:hypothetical protein
LQVIEHLPEQRLHHVGIALFVRMRESVAARRGRRADRKQLRAVVTQGVAQIVQPNAMCQLAIKKADHVAPWRECPTLFVDPILGSQTADHPDGDELAKLIEYDRTVLGWFWFFHLLTSLVGSQPKPTTFLLFRKSLWDDCEYFTLFQKEIVFTDIAQLPSTTNIS